MTEDEKLDFIEASICDALLEPEVWPWVLYHKWRRLMLFQTGESRL